MSNAAERDTDKVSVSIRLSTTLAHPPEKSARCVDKGFDDSIDEGKDNTQLSMTMESGTMPDPDIKQKVKKKSHPLLHLSFNVSASSRSKMHNSN